MLIYHSANAKNYDGVTDYRNEDSVGKGLRESGLDRDDLFVTTKYAGGDIQAAIRTSLSKVSVDSDSPPCSGLVVLNERDNS